MTTQKKRKRLDENKYPYAICPKCGARVYAMEYKLDRKQKIKYLCPTCKAIIANNEAEAKDLYYEPIQDPDDKKC